VSEPVAVFEVTGLGPLRTRLQRAVGRGLTKFVGRQREVEALKQAAEMAKVGHGQLAAVVGEAGVGKSRLFYEFKAVTQSGCMVLETFSVSHGKASAYLPVIELLHGYFDIRAEDDARKRREKIIGKVLGLDRSLEDTLPYLFALLGLVEGADPLAQMEAQLRRRRTHEAIKRLVLRESVHQPLLVLIEDLQWIDTETEALLNLLADAIGTAKVLLAVNYRPEYTHMWGSKTYYRQVRLDPLGRESAEEMLWALLGVSSPPPRETVDKLCGRASRRPLETLRHGARRTRLLRSRLLSRRVLLAPCRRVLAASRRAPAGTHLTRVTVWDRSSASSSTAPRAIRSSWKRWCRRWWIRACCNPRGRRGRTAVRPYN
jgi:hypothetical protein